MEGGFLRERIDDPALPSSFPATSSQQTRSVAHTALAAGPRLASDSKGGACNRCSSLSYSDDYYRAFGVALCNQCRRLETLISKSTAKRKYLLTDGELKKLGFLKRKNPHKPDWQPMQLLLESQVQQLAQAKHGGEQAIEQKVRETLDRKLQARVRRREEEKQKETKQAERLERIKRKIEQDEGLKPPHADVDAEDVEDI